jgi:hypothetical protein
MKDVGIFYVHLEYFMAIWYILWPFWYIYPRFGRLYQEQSGNPVLHTAAVQRTYQRYIL